MASTYYDAYYSGDTAHRIKLQLHIYTVATDLANLKTTERADLYMVVSDASSQWWNNYGTEAYVGIGGNDKTATVNFDARTTGNKTLISSWDTVVTHNSDGSKGIGVSAHHYSGVGLGNATIEPTIYYCDTLTVTPSFTTNPTITSKTETSVTVNRGATDISSNFYWSTNNSTWTKFSNSTATITGLSPNTSYTIYIQARNSNAENFKTTKTLSVTTYAVPTQRAVTKSEAGVQMYWEADSTVDYVWYSINNGSSWVEVGSTDGTSGIYAIRNLTAGTTYNIKTRIRRKTTQTTYDTTSLSVKTYALPTQSLASKTETTITMNWSLDSEANQLYYSTNGGSSWSDAVVVSGTSGTYTITGLSANTNYSVLLRLRRAATLTNVQPSSATSVTTYDFPYATTTPDFTIGNAVSIGLYNPLGRNLTVTMLGADGSTVYSGNGWTGTSIGAFNTASIIANLYSSIPNSQSGKYTIKIQYSTSTRTKQGGTYKIKGTEKPTFSNFTYEDTDTTYTTPLTGNNQIIVNGFSDIKVTISSANKATGNNSATISKYRVTNGNVSKEVTYSTSDVTAIFTNQTSQVISVTAIDSRGLETTVSKAVTFKDYQKITVTKVAVERENGIGTKVYFDLKGTYWNGNFGATNNSMQQIYYRWREVGGTYSNYIKVTNSISSSDGNFQSISSAFLPTTDNGTVPQEFELGKGYEIQLVPQDKLYDAYWSTQTVLLDSGIPCTDKYKDSNGYYHEGINQLAEDDVALAITGGFKVDGERITDGIIVSVSEPSTKEKVWIQKGKNIFDGITTNGYINYDGEIDVSNDWLSSSSYLPVEPNTTYIISGTNMGTRLLYMQYNGSKATVGSRHETTPNTSFTTFASTKYIRFSTNATNATAIQLEQGSKSTSYEPYVEPKTYIRNDNGIYEEYIPKVNATFTLIKEVTRTETGAFTLTIPDYKNYDEIIIWVGINNDGSSVTFKVIDGTVLPSSSRVYNWLSGTYFALTTIYWNAEYELFSCNLQRLTGHTSQTAKVYGIKYQ